MKEKDPRPFLVVTGLVDQAARPAAVTRSHGDSMERALQAIGNHDIAGLELVELPIPPHAFEALRKQLQVDTSTVCLYDLFPLASQLSPPVLRVAGQFLAAEALWALEEQTGLGGVPLHVKLDLPDGWDKDPRQVHAKLIEAGALELTEQGIDTFKTVKTTWDAATR